MFLKVDHLSKTFITPKKTHHVFDHIDLEIKEGEFICLLGPSGCGKSTLLNIIAGLEQASSGSVFMDGIAISSPGPDRIVMFQESALFPWLNVLDNVTFGLKMKGIPKKEREEVGMKFLQLTHLGAFKNTFVHELSGGMKQRVALARCLSMNSKVLLMDEPFGALDSQTRYILQMELQKIWQETKKTIIFVTHSVEEAVLLADRVILMSSHPGGIKSIKNIDVKRPRQVEDIEVMKNASEILIDLKEEVEKVAKNEFDMSWHL